MMKTKTKLKREYRKRLKAKMPKQQYLSLNESATIQYGAYGCYGCTALKPWLTVDSISADHQHVFIGRFDKTGTKLKLKNKWKRKSHCWAPGPLVGWVGANAQSTDLSPASSPRYSKAKVGAYDLVWPLQGKAALMNGALCDSACS